MALLIKIVGALIATLLILYYGSMFIMPSITIVNETEHVLTEVKIALPSNNLDFGKVEPQQENTLHYSLDQQNGSYNYIFSVANEELLAGSCGVVADNEVHKRVIITISADNKVTCQ